MPKPFWGLKSELLPPRNPVVSLTEAIRLEKDQEFPEFRLLLLDALMASGYRWIPGESSSEVITLLPCPLGTVSNHYARWSSERVKCPPGMLLSIFTHMSSRHIGLLKQKTIFAQDYRVQLPEDWFGTPIWSPFLCFGTSIWPP